MGNAYEHTSLAERLLAAYDGEVTARTAANRELQQFFNAIGLPLPKKSEYWDTNTKDGTMIFIEKYGVILRINTRKLYDQEHRNLPDHPFVLQPLTKYVGRYYAFELYPGIHVGDTGNEYKHDRYNYSVEDEALITEIFKKDGLDCTEPGDFNRGYIDKKNEDFPKGFPVVLDPKRTVSARCIHSYWCPDDITFSMFKTHPLTLQYNNIQKDFFAPVKQAVQAAWKEDKKPNRAMVPKMWEALKQIKQEGKLVNGWLEQENMEKANIPDYGKKFTDISGNYAKHIDEHRAHAL